jgi:hypothetical protein
LRRAIRYNNKGLFVIIIKERIMFDLELVKNALIAGDESKLTELVKMP